MALVPLAAGLAATAVALATIGAMVYFTYLSLRSDRHSPRLD